MASLKQLSMAIVISLIFGILLVSSSLTAAVRIMDTGDGPCYFTGRCGRMEDCFSQCTGPHVLSHGVCVPDPRHPQKPQPHVCCCLWDRS
ncbi:hypothetical protein MKX03_035998 [Papaver bracteatum]|nr:hypothetical protein MKX03_035998 [Papaver bracteatum]